MPRRTCTPDALGLRAIAVFDQEVRYGGFLIGGYFGENPFRERLDDDGFFAIGKDLTRLTAARKGS